MTTTDNENLLPRNIPTWALVALGFVAATLNLLVLAY